MRTAVRLFAVVLLLSLTVIPSAIAQAPGFDEFGYNYKAKVFVGEADGVDRILDGKVWGDPTYTYDHLVMKWSKEWDDARFHGAPWGPKAWVINEWNGQVPMGSGETWHYKIVWSGACADNQPAPGGGYCIWGQFAVVMDQGVSTSSFYCESNGGGHQFCTRAIPNGLGYVYPP